MIFENGMTVKELKELIADWPERDRHGEPSEVWVSTKKNLSSPVRSAHKLNLGEGDNCDILLAYDTN